MKTSSKGIKLIESFEGLRLTSYQDSVKVWTIGYGHTGKVNGKTLKAGMKISKSKANSLIKSDLSEFEKGVDKLVNVKLTQHQFDALVSFSYNLGLGNLGSSTLLKYVNKKQFAKASAEFIKWNKAGGKVLNGLTRRRAAEKKLFLSK